ncbi:hypothetical protein EDI_091680 [Entamoeba dispar SAW760]|uniref:Adhesin domain-containing protein n=1 Tax=Entamoeba dispar (strain ATCC PRA-260 / SAW760) TaxID=370354 RepID=B0ED00_ENTDS|nr:uncharacterized protein EDI_091680 [Entamoeba dispar SAW760]EDR27417.1 hypothetical protein EDI_091680 [Entamoeba dispar SAW760]|eukprot:EDR27417.1 hypothetical protein EDI_091680 [Entamoeba dispar SAW760]
MVIETKQHVKEREFKNKENRVEEEVFSLINQNEIDKLIKYCDRKYLTKKIIKIKEGNGVIDLRELKTMSLRIELEKGNLQIFFSKNLKDIELYSGKGIINVDLENSALSNIKIVGNVRNNGTYLYTINNHTNKIDIESDKCIQLFCKNSSNLMEMRISADFDEIVFEKKLTATVYISNKNKKGKVVLRNIPSFFYNVTIEGKGKGIDVSVRAPISNLIIKGRVPSIEIEAEPWISGGTLIIDTDKSIQTMIKPINNYSLFKYIGKPTLIGNFNINLFEFYSEFVIPLLTNMNGLLILHQ